MKTKIIKDKINFLKDITNLDYIEEIELYLNEDYDYIEVLICNRKFSVISTKNNVILFEENITKNQSKNIIEKYYTFEKALSEWSLLDS